MNLKDLFPNLSDHHYQITSPRTVKYNCIAWAAHNSKRWWQPGVNWPTNVSRDDCGVGTLVAAFAEIGFEECEDDALEDGYEKVALYGSGLMYTHAARQLFDGQWTSKLGQLEDITHSTPDVISGGDYGEVVQFMRRRIEVEKDEVPT